MPVVDRHGLSVSLETDAALTAWNGLNHAVLAHSAATAGFLTELGETAPNFALGHAARGHFMLLLGRRELVAVARDALASAEASVANNGSDARTDAYIQALALYLNGRMRAAAERLDAWLQVTPTDALAVKIVHGIRFILGDNVGMRRSLEAVVPHYEGAGASDGYVRGCFAFALEETGERRAAEQQGLQGLDWAPDDAWGLHAVAHVYEMAACPADGITLVEGRPDAWDHCNNFRAHIWWHLALFYIDRGALDKALQLYDAEVRIEQTDDYRDIANAASLLVRLELEGVEVGSRWQELAEKAANRIDDACVVFGDLHYQMALAATGRWNEADALSARLTATGASGDGDMAQVSADPGAAAARGILAFRQARYEDAYRRLAEARDNMQTVGGSHAQRDVFERLTIDAALRAGRPAEARSLLLDRARKRGAVDGYAERRLEVLTAPVRAPIAAPLAV